MRDAMGGTVALVIISVFIVIALGYMAFNVNYTKAFRMKNKIISVYEDFDGKCENNSECNRLIRDYANTLGYSTGDSLNCDDYTKSPNNLYCYKRIDAENKVNGNDIVEDDNRYYYKIITKINIEIPIINNILDLQAFYITGDTKLFKN